MPTVLVLVLVRPHFCLEVSETRPACGIDITFVNKLSKILA